MIVGAEMSNRSSSAAAAATLAGKSQARTTKRQRATKRSDEVDGQQTYYDRLMHQCRRDLHKQAKVTKNFEIQKLIRKIKEQKPMPADDNNGGSVEEEKCHSIKKHNPATAKQQERKLQQLKDYDLEAVIQECYRRLGVLQLNPQRHQPQAAAVATAPAGYPPDKVDSTKSPDDDVRKQEERNHMTTTTAFVAEDSAWILERILQHKSMIAALEKWNEHVTEYRRWCLRQQERSEGILPPKPKRKQKTSKNSNDKASSVVFVSKNDPLGSGSSLFVTLGGGGDEDDGSDPDTVVPARSSTGDIMDNSYYGPAGTGNAENLKKNRQGQRGRRAKAAAVEAKKRGRTLRPEDSLNWRQPSKKQHDGSAGGDSGGYHQHQHGHPQNAVIPPPSVPPPEHLHPSWQARKEKKEGIVAFQGKKITFGDDD